MSLRGHKQRKWINHDYSSLFIWILILMSKVAYFSRSAKINRVTAPSAVLMLFLFDVNCIETGIILQILSTLADCIYVIHPLGDRYWEKLCPRSWVRSRAVLRPRSQLLPIRTDLGLWITFFFSNSDFKVSEKISFTLQRKCVEVGRVRVNEARDRLQTKTNITWLLAR